MIAPLVVQFDVRATPEHAFEVWTERCALWWPPAHTLSKRPATIRFEPFPGGRIYETAGDGAEHLWGDVIDWEPPARIRYRWHLFFDRSEATEVEVTFRAGGGGTTVRIEQRGWEGLGDAGEPRRARTEQVWEALGPRFATACEAVRASN